MAKTKIRRKREIRNKLFLYEEIAQSNVGEEIDEEEEVKLMGNL